MTLARPLLSTLSTLLCLFTALPETMAHQAPLCHRLFVTPTAQFKSDINSRLSSHIYEDVLFQVDQLLELLGPLPDGYQVILKNHYGQGAKHVFGSRLVEFTEIHTTYQRYTGTEDPHLTLPILVHEYSHAYFETAMRELSPLWEKNSKFLDIPFGDPQLKKEISARISVYHEFFADLIPALLFNNPRAMIEALQFHESSPPSRSISFRHWDWYQPERDLPQLKQIFENDDSGTSYVYLTPLRRTLWNNLKEVDNPEVLKKRLHEIVSVFAHDYQQRAETGSFSFTRMNHELEQALNQIFLLPSDN